MEFTGRLSSQNLLSSPVPPTRGNNKGKRRKNQPRPIAAATSSPLQTSVAGPSSQCVVDYSIPSRPRIRHVPSSYGMGDRLGLPAAAPRSTSRASNRSVHSSHSAAPRSRSRISARDGDGHVAMARSPSQIDAAAPITISNDSMEPPPPYMPPSPPRAPKPVVTSSSTSQLPVPDVMLPASDSSDAQSSSPESSSDESITDPEDSTALMFQIAWEHDREAGYSMDDRVARDFERRKAAENATSPRRELPCVPTDISGIKSVGRCTNDTHSAAQLLDGSAVTMRQVQNSFEQRPDLARDQDQDSENTLVSARREDTHAAAISRSTTSPPAPLVTPAIPAPHLRRPLPLPPPSTTPGPASAYVSIFRAPPPTSQDVITMAPIPAPPDPHTLNSLLPPSGNSYPEPSEASGPNRTSFTEQILNPAPSLTPNNIHRVRASTDTPQSEQDTASASTSGLSPFRDHPSLSRRSRGRSGSVPVSPSSFPLSPSSSSRARPRSPVLGPSLSDPRTVMDRVGTFEAFTTRYRPPPPPRRQSLLSRPASAPLLDPESEEESSGAQNSRGQYATALSLLASQGDTENGASFGQTLVAADDSDHIDAPASPLLLSNRPRSEAALLTPTASFATAASRVLPRAGVSQSDLGQSIAASPVTLRIVDDRETPTNSLNPPADHARQEESRPQQSFEYTDLDLLVARLDSPAAAQNTSYEDLLAITDFVGPAIPPSSAANLQVVENLPVAPVQVERRRITKDGRKKLKLSLMGIVVDRCGVCMSQFKQHDSGVLLPCHHS